MFTFLEKCMPHPISVEQSWALGYRCIYFQAPGRLGRRQTYGRLLQLNPISIRQCPQQRKGSTIDFKITAEITRLVILSRTTTETGGGNRACFTHTPQGNRLQFKVLNIEITERGQVAFCMQSQKNKETEKMSLRSRV